MPDKYKNSRSNKLPLDVVSRISADTVDWSLHEELINSLSRELCKQSSQVTGSKPNEIRYLICSWLIGQLKAIASHAGETSVSSVVLSSETLFHFELMSNDFADRSHQLSADFPFGKKSTGDSTVKLLYLLTAAFEGSSLGGLENSFELSLNFDTSEIISPRGLQPALGKLELGEPVSLDAVVEPSSARSFGCTVSSLSWMKEPISHSIDRKLSFCFGASRLEWDLQIMYFWSFIRCRFSWEHYVR